MIDGVLVIDKPIDSTSHDIVQHIRTLTGERRIGHAGTLDPFATGVLLLGLGNATRLLEYVQDLPKTYEATFVLGATSDTDDVTGTRTPQKIYDISESQVRNALTTFIGTIEQIPPAYSAVKYEGKKLYEVARVSPEDARKKAQQRVRTVEIQDITLHSYAYPRISLTITCGSGTYIRSLARDMGQELGCGAYVETLRRTAIGNFSATQAVPTESLTAETIHQFLLPIDSLILHLSRIDLTKEQVDAFTQGKFIPASSHEPTHPVGVFYDHQLVGIGKIFDETLRPTKVFL